MSIDPLRLRRSLSPTHPDEDKSSEGTKLPTDVLREIFHYLTDQELAKASMTCHIWKRSMDTHFLLNLRRRGFYQTCIFGEKQWKRYFGHVGKTPPIPRNIGKIFQDCCPFWPDKKIHETHLLALIPSAVNGKPFTLNYFEELTWYPSRGGKCTNYRNYDQHVESELGERRVGHSYWVLMTKDVIPGSRRKTYQQQCQMIADYREKTGLPYKVPLAIEATAVILTHYIKTKEPLYTDDQLGKEWTHTRCEEKIIYGCWPVSVGGFSSAGVSLDHYEDYKNDYCGVAGVRKV